MKMLHLALLLGGVFALNKGNAKRDDVSLPSYIPPLGVDPIDVPFNPVLPGTIPDLLGEPTSTTVSGGWTWDELFLIEEVSAPIRAAFGSKVIDICYELDINPNWLMCVMHYESRLNPQAVNPNTNATGLIQFLKGTAEWLDTSLYELYNMGHLEQLDYVYDFLVKDNKYPYIHSFIDCYLAIFYPVAIWHNYDWDQPFSTDAHAFNLQYVSDGVMSKRTIAEYLLDKYPQMMYYI